MGQRQEEMEEAKRVWTKVRSGRQEGKGRQDRAAAGSIKRAPTHIQHPTVLLPSCLQELDAMQPAARAAGSSRMSVHTHQTLKVPRFNCCPAAHLYMYSGAGDDAACHQGG